MGIRVKGEENGGEERRSFGREEFWTRSFGRGVLQTRLDLLYEARTHSHSSRRLATSRIVSAQGQRNLLFDIVSLSLFSAILEDTCFFLIGRLMMQRRGQLASPPGTLPRRLLS